MHFIAFENPVSNIIGIQTEFNFNNCFARNELQALFKKRST